MSYSDCCDWSACTRCGDCLVQCPKLSLNQEQARKAMDQLIAGEMPDAILKDCTFCFDCNALCPEGLRPHELILERALEQRGKVPAMLQYLINGQPNNLFSDLYGRLDFAEQQILSRWAELPPSSEEVLFVGCVGRLSCYDIENSQVLSPLPIYGPADLCCGELAYRLGSWKSYTDIVERTVARLEQLDTRRLVCYCGSCCNYLSSILPQVYGHKLPFEVISLYEWLDERMSRGEISPVQPTGGRAAVHESCYVSELGDEFAATLRRLYQACGMECAELAHHGKENLSCGAVSVVRTLNIGSSMFREQRRKYREIAASGTRSVALNCPGCFITMGFTAPMFGVKLRYMPEEILTTFGDTVSKPLSTRIPLIVASFARRLPGLLRSRTLRDLPSTNLETPAMESAFPRPETRHPEPREIPLDGPQPPVS